MPAGGGLAGSRHGSVPTSAAPRGAQGLVRAGQGEGAEFQMYRDVAALMDLAATEPAVSPDVSLASE